MPTKPSASVAARREAAKQRNAELATQETQPEDSPLRAGDSRERNEDLPLYIAKRDRGAPERSILRKLVVASPDKSRIVEFLGRYAAIEATKREPPWGVYVVDEVCLGRGPNGQREVHHENFRQIDISDPTILSKSCAETDEIRTLIENVGLYRASAQRDQMSDALRPERITVAETR